MIVDVLVLSLLVRGQLTGSDFRVLPDRSVRLSRDGLERFLRAYDGRVTSRIRHPALDQRLTYRQAIARQVELLVAYLRGARGAYQAFRWR